MDILRKGIPCSRPSVLRREYSPDVVAEILQRVASLDVCEKARVVLACLKVAHGDHRRLQGALEDAPGYYRELLSEAEYPLATKRWSRMRELPDLERSSIYERDWNQYVAWLGREVLAAPSEDDG
jgi:hypothetical protein